MRYVFNLSDVFARTKDKLHSLKSAIKKNCQNTEGKKTCLKSLEIGAPFIMKNKIKIDTKVGLLLVNR